MLAERLQAKFSRDFCSTDSIQTALVKGGVFTHDGLKEWKADSVPYEDSYRGGGQSSLSSSSSSSARYSKSSHSVNVDPSLSASNDLVNKLVNKMAKFKAMQQYDKADAVREGLRAKFNVLINDRLMEWSVGGDFGEEHNARRELALTFSDRGYVKSRSSLSLEDEEEEECVQHNINARAVAKKERNFEGADRIRLNLAQW